MCAAAGANGGRKQPGTGRMRNMKMGPQSARYVVVGALAFCVDFGVTWLAIKWLPLLAANTIGFIAANAFNFLLAHGWVFGARFERKQFVPVYAAVLTVSLVGLLVSVGEGKLSVADVRAILASKERTARVLTAPPRGLFLIKVFYS